MIKNEFEWDENKNKSNKRKHGIDFNKAKEVFKDKDRKVEADLRKDYGEERWKLIGVMLKIIVVVIYTIRGVVTRIISVRKANKKEKAEYNEQKQSKKEKQDESENEDEDEK